MIDFCRMITLYLSIKSDFLRKWIKTALVGLLNAFDFVYCYCYLINLGKETLSSKSWPSQPSPSGLWGVVKLPEISRSPSPGSLSAITKELHQNNAHWRLGITSSLSTKRYFVFETFAPRSVLGVATFKDVHYDKLRRVEVKICENGKLCQTFRSVSAKPLSSPVDMCCRLV